MPAKKGAVAHVEDVQQGLSRYTGEMSRDHRSGFGAMRYSNNEIYVGEWRRGRRSGQGVYFYADGAVYDGAWVDDKAHGDGMCQYPTGNIYRGQWRHGKVSGKGAMFYNDGDAYDGEWSEGRLHGQGRFYNTDGDVHEGQWYEDKALENGNGQGGGGSHSSSPAQSPKGMRVKIEVRRQMAVKRAATLQEELQRRLGGSITLEVLKALAGTVRATEEGLDREPTEPVVLPNVLKPPSPRSEATSVFEQVEDPEEDGSSSSGFTSSFGSMSQKGELERELQRFKGIYDEMKGERGNVTWGALADRVKSDPGARSIVPQWRHRPESSQEASWTDIRQWIANERREGAAAQHTSPTDRPSPSRPVGRANPIESFAEDMESVVSKAEYSEKESDLTESEETIRVAIDDDESESANFSMGRLRMWGRGRSSGGGGGGLASRPSSSIGVGLRGPSADGLAVARAPLPHGSPERSKAVERVLSLCGPAHEPFSLSRFVRTFFVMLFPYPFLKCGPCPLNNVSLEREYVVTGAAPRWMEEPGEYLTSTSLMLPLLLAMCLFAFTPFGHMPENDERIAPSDIVIPFTFLILLALTTAAYFAFPRKKAHFLEALPDTQFNLLAKFMYGTVVNPEHWSVKWASHSEFGGGGFVTYRDRTSTAIALFGGFLVALAIPIHRMIEDKSFFGESSSEVVIATTGFVVIWVCCFSTYSLIIKVINVQKILLDQMQALTNLAHLSSGENDGLGLKIGSAHSFDLSVTGLTENLFSPTQNDHLKSLLGWYICRSFVLYGSPVMCHNRRSAVISVNVFAVVCSSILLLTTFIYEAIVYKHPTHTDRVFTLATVYILLTSPMLFYHMRLWTRVSYCYKRHRMLMSAAATCKRVQVMGLNTPIVASLEADLITSLADYMTRHDHRPKCLGIKITPMSVILVACVQVLALGTLVHRWIRLGIDTSSSTPAEITLTLVPP